jgi:hypothetical protein
MESHDRDQFDDLLDGAVRHYGNVEPRAGLEGRVLARLAAEAIRRQNRAWWMWAVGGASIALLAVGIWIGIGRHKPNTPEVAVRPNVPEEAAQRTAAVKKPAELQKPLGNRVRPRRSEPVITARNAEPRLAQFPSPRSISEQEMMLVEYVDQYPQEAILIAKEQDEFQKKVAQAEREIENGSSSDQQEK